jgi:hypothetical protein
MDANKKQLVVAGQPLAINQRDGALTAKGVLVGARVFIAMKAGMAHDRKDVEGMTTKDVIAKIEADGLATKEQCKTWEKEYKAHKSAHYAASSQIGGLFIASPEWRKSFKTDYNAKGEPIGGTLTFRKERSANASLASQLAAIRAENAKLQAQLKAAGLQLPAPAVA